MNSKFNGVPDKAVSAAESSFSFLCMGRDHVRDLVMKRIPKTVPSVTASKAFSLLGHRGANFTPISVHKAVYILQN